MTFALYPKPTNKKMNITVLFNDVEEFTKELEQSPNVFEKTVRLTGQYRHTSIQPLRHLYLMGTFITTGGQGGGKLVKLERYCGQVMSGEKDARAMEIYEKQSGEVEAFVKKTGLTVRPGIYVTAEVKEEA